MNEQENVAAIRKMYADFGAGDMLGVLNVMDEDVVWKQPPDGPKPFAGTIRGRDQFDAWLAQMEDVSDVEAFAPQEFFAQGNRVIVLGHYVLRSKATGKVWESDWAHVWTFSGRRVIEGWILEDTLAQAIALDWRP